MYEQYSDSVFVNTWNQIVKILTKIRKETEDELDHELLCYDSNDMNLEEDDDDNETIDE